MNAVLVEVGGAVEAPDLLWHITRNADTTVCGEDYSDWPRVVCAVERAGIWCRDCLTTAARGYLA